MTTDLSKIPLHLRRKIGLSPWSALSIWGCLIAFRWAQSYVISRGNVEFIVFTALATALCLGSLLPFLPVTLDIDERGIRKAIHRREQFYPWSEIADLKVTESGGRAGGGTIRFIRPGEIEANKLVDLSPGMFGSNAAELASVIRQGIDRWGPHTGVGRLA